MVHLLGRNGSDGLHVSESSIVLGDWQAGQSGSGRPRTLAGV